MLERHQERVVVERVVDPEEPPNERDGRAVFVNHRVAERCVEDVPEADEDVNLVLKPRSFGTPFLFRLLHLEAAA